MTAALDENVVRLARLDTCAVSDALDKLGLRGVVSGLTPLSSRRRIAGRVHTVRLIAIDTAPANSGPPRHLGSAAIESSSAGDIIVVEQLTGREAGSWGGLLSLGAKVKGVAGVISEGLIRDVDEARDLDFPIFARGCTARTARGRVVEEATDVQISVGDVAVAPGDYVLADGSAVVFIEASNAATVLDAAEAIVAREAAMSKALLSGMAITRVMGADYEHMLKG